MQDNQSAGQPPSAMAAAARLKPAIVCRPPPEAPPAIPEFQHPTLRPDTFEPTSEDGAVNDRTAG
jgi:hypothetical protein